MQGLEIRFMREGDLPEVCALEQEAFSVPWSRKAFEDSMKLPYVMLLTAEYQGKVAGYCGCYQSLDTAEITNVAVRRELRGQGIAEEILRELFRQGKMRGIQEYLLEVRVSNHSAVRLYERLGFKRAGLRRGFYEKPVEDALIMTAIPTI